MQNFVGRAHLDDAATLHDRDAVADAHGFVEIVGDEDDRAAMVFLEGQKFVLHFGADQRVEGRKGLVHQENRRIVGERTGKAHALLHAARQFVRIVPAIGAEPDLCQRVLSPCVPLLGRHAGQFQPEGGVLKNRHMRHEREGLEHHGDMLTAKRHQLRLAHGGDVLAADDDLASRRCDQPVQHPHQSRLAGARKAHHDEDFALSHREARIANAEHHSGLGEYIILPKSLAVKFDGLLRLVAEDFEEMSDGEDIGITQSQSPADARPRADGPCSLDLIMRRL